MDLRRVPLAALAACALWPASAAASSSQISIFEAAREVSGTNDELRLQTLDEVKALGATHIRVLFYWGKTVVSRDARTKPEDFDGSDPDSAGYDWSTYDAVVREAGERGLQVIPTLTGPVPRWATAGARNHLFKPDRDEFADFAQAAGARYGDDIDTWSVWNEPNLGSFLQPQYVKGKPYSPLLYRALYQAALQGLGASGNGDDDVIAGETAPFGLVGKRVPPIPFAKLFFRGKRLDVDGWATHPYSPFGGPFQTVRRSSGNVTIAVIGRLIKTLDRVSKHPGLGLYITEFGVQSKPDPLGVSLARQNDFRNLSEKVAYDNPRIKAFAQYLMRDDARDHGGGEAFGGFESGLRLASGAEKPAYAGYRLPVVASRRGSGVRLWGLVRPATEATSVEVQQRDGGAWKTIGTADTTASGYWRSTATYRKNRTFRVRWEDFDSPAASIL